MPNINSKANITGALSPSVSGSKISASSMRIGPIQKLVVMCHIATFDQMKKAYANGFNGIYDMGHSINSPPMIIAARKNDTVTPAFHRLLKSKWNCIETAICVIWSENYVNPTNPYKTPVELLSSVNFLIPCFLWSYLPPLESGLSGNSCTLKRGVPRMWSWRAWIFHPWFTVFQVLSISPVRESSGVPGESALMAQ